MSNYSKGNWRVKHDVVESGEGRCVCALGVVDSEEEMDANGRLIESAPELLESLNEIADNHCSGCCDNDDCDYSCPEAVKARELMAKIWGVVTVKGFFGAAEARGKMIKKIYKYAIPITDDFHIPLPEGSEILTVQVQHEIPNIWVLFDKDAPMKNRHFRLAGTGHEIDMSKYYKFVYKGSFQMAQGQLVFHLFDVGDK